MLPNRDKADDKADDASLNAEQQLHARQGGGKGRRGGAAARGRTEEGYLRVPKQRPPRKPRAAEELLQPPQGIARAKMCGRVARSHPVMPRYGA